MQRRWRFAEKENKKTLFCQKTAFLESRFFVFLLFLSKLQLSQEGFWLCQGLVGCICRLSNNDGGFLSLSLFPPLVRSVGEKLERPSCRCFSPLFFLEELQPKLSPFWTVMHCEFLRTCACVSRSSSSSSLWTRSSPRTEGLSCFFFGLVGIAPLSTNGSFSNVGVGVVRPEFGAVKKYDGPKFLGRFGCSWRSPKFLDYGFGPGKVCQALFGFTLKLLSGHWWCLFSLFTRRLWRWPETRKNATC